MRPGVSGVPESGSEMGYVVGENSSDYFRFVMDAETPVKKWEYVSVMSGESEVIGRIERVLSRSDLLNEDLGFESTRKYVDNRIFDEVSVCHVRSLGVFRNGVLELSRDLIRPGSSVHRTSRETLQNLFGFGTDKGLYLGNLVDRDDVEVTVDLNGFRRHLAILAQTGAGKSNSAAVIMEELLKKGASIIVLDPHADYVLMRKTEGGSFFSDSIKIFRTPFSTGRYGAENKGFVEEFVINFQDLSAEDLSDIMDIKEEWTNLRRIVEDLVRIPGSRKSLSSFTSAVEELNEEERSRISGRVRLLNKIKDIFGERSTSTGEYLSPGQLTILDLSGMDQFLANYFSYKVVQDVYDRKSMGEYSTPVFLVIEEAHNFVPPASRWHISSLIKKIASEGRKFGIFLIVITQRPGKIDQDVLSQCNSEIIMRITNPLDQKAVLESGERISENIIQDLPSLNVGEAIITGEFTRIPSIIRVRRRETMEGGGDVDIVGELLKARKERDSRFSTEENRKHISNLFGD